MRGQKESWFTINMSTKEETEALAKIFYPDFNFFTYNQLIYLNLSHRFPKSDSKYLSISHERLFQLYKYLI